MLREAAYGLFGLITVAFTFEWILGLFDDPREPPRLQSRIPLFGHIIGMLQDGMQYYVKTSNQTTADMYTLRIFSTKIYVCNAQHLIAAIQKSSKTLSFRPFIQSTAKTLGDASPATQELYGGDMTDRFSHSMRGGLAPGPHLDAQNLRMGRCAVVHVNRLAHLEEISLLEWIRHVIVDASSCGVYGEQHPYRDAKVEAAFWIWHQYMTAHLVGLDLTGKGYAARKVVFDAVSEYSKTVPEDSARILHDRLRVLRDVGISEKDAWKQEATFGFAVFANTAPTLFWTIFEIFSRPDILEAMRQELLTQAVSKEGEDFVLDVAALKTRCHLPLSMLQETQRIRHQNASIRKVMADTVLDGRYVLKKGNYVQMPGQPINTSESLWGPTAKEFDPYRFVPKEKEKTGSSQTKFMAWGTPPNLCPARQFASTEILILVALVVLRVDLKPATASGKWPKHYPTLRGDSATVPNPAKDIKTRVTELKEASGTWRLMMGDSMTRVSLASG